MSLNMTTSQAGLKQIMQFEGMKTKAYKDSGGLPTIGCGTIKYPNGKAVQMGDTCTPDQAVTFMQTDAKKFEKVINDNVKVPLNQNQFDALMCFIYNVGAGGFTGSSVLRHLNTGNYTQAANDLLAWDKVHGVVNQGLLNRRNAERKLFLTPCKPVQPVVNTPQQVVQPVQEPVQVPVVTQASVDTSQTDICSPTDPQYQDGSFSNPDNYG